MLLEKNNLTREGDEFMSNSSLVTYTKISPNRTSPRTHKIDTVTIHCTAGNNTAKGILNLAHFVNSNSDHRASCNYAIGYDGSIGLGVEEKDRSWCTSNGENDHRAITIEVSSSNVHPYTVSDAAYKALIDLLVDICQRNGISQLKWKGDKSLIGKPEQQNMTVHRWYANKACPGEYLYSRHAQIAGEVNGRLGKANVSEPTTTPPDVSTVEATLNVGDLVSLSADAKYYNGTEVAPWVKKRRWFIKKINGDRVVIDKSEDGKNAINSPIHEKFLTVVKPKADVPYMVQVSISDLNIRKGPGTNYGKTGRVTGKGVFTIVEVSGGSGSATGWGKLKSGNGWISLDYAKRV